MTPAMPTLTKKGRDSSRICVLQFKLDSMWDRSRRTFKFACRRAREAVVITVASVVRVSDNSGAASNAHGG
jgi:hypothetical protein